MLPTINNKSFLECNEADLKTIIENPDYRENEYIDYKKNLHYLEIPKEEKERKTKIAQGKSEFKSDVCAFANAEGGYLILGISDDNGCASELCGIEIPNNDTDKFELDRRNDLTGIQPRIPSIKFHFIKIEDQKYIVILYIKHDSFAPYLHVENEKNYQAFRRTGNKKATMTYTELRNMFNQSLSLDKEIYNYRKERIQYYNEQSEEKDDIHSRFLLLHIIPDTFTDSSFSQNVFFLEKDKQISFASIFNEFSSNQRSMPCVDGLHFLHDERAFDKTEGYVNNNGVIECFFPLKNHLHLNDNYHKNGFFARDYIWDRINGALFNYKKIFESIISDCRIYICLSIIGCKGITTQTPEEEGWIYYTGSIDRDRIMCNPIVVEKLSDNDNFWFSLKMLQIEYLQSIGVKYDKKLDALMKEVYNI